VRVSEQTAEMGATWAPPVAPALPVDEERLVELARTDRQAFAELYRRHVGTVYGHLVRQCGSKQVAEDVTSATFERALRHIGEFRWQPPGIRPWLLRIASNELAGWYRREGRSERPRGQYALRALSSVGGQAEHGPGGDDEAFDTSTLAQVQAALRTLPARYQEVIGLRLVAGLSADETARTLGWSKPTVAVTLHRAVVALRRAMSAPAPRREAHR
jgi:RNA polymerase sigma-70 factor (ECF subfamily)